MNHTRIRFSLATALLVIASVVAFAHNGVEHIMGTVKAVTESSITVETVKHTTVTVMIDPSTTYTHQDAKASLKDLKVGERVVVNAKETADKKLQGISVRWGASSKSPMDHGDHSMGHGDHKM